jgi:endonuclease G
MTLVRTIGQLVAAVILLLATDAYARVPDCSLTAADQARFRAEHLFGGQPIAGPVSVRRAYVTQYDPAHRVPRWVAWTERASYRSSIDRHGRWATFRDDPGLASPVHDHDYDGLEKDLDYARGHMTPYFISGGDRNSNGRTGTTDDFDACTVFEVNYMSNVTPQSQSHFNGAGGLWYALETIERDRILPRGIVLHVIAGTIFGPDPQMVGPHHDIAVPDMFYRILVTDQGAIPFLFVHRRRLGPAGCDLSARLEACIVTVADIERLTGADFFNGLGDARERAIESSDGAALWRVLSVRR